VIAKGINDIPTTAPWMVKFFPGGKEEASNYTKASSKEFTPICPDCGRLLDHKMTPHKIYSRHKIPCPCHDGISMPNKMIRNIMEQSLRLGMITFYDKEYVAHDKTGVRRKFDIIFTALDGAQYFVEMDGGYHGEIIKKHRKTPTVIPESLFVHDLLKDELAETLNIKMIRIDCYRSEIEYIKKNLYNSELSNVIDLDKIDWMEVEDFCFNNLMRKVCDYKNQNPNKFASEIAEVFNLETQTIRKYLKRGVRLNLCEYEPENEAKRANTTRKFRSIRVYVKNIDTNQEWFFDSLKSFRDSSEKVLDGVKMTKGMLEKRFSKTDEDHIFFETNKHRFLIKKIRSNN